MKAVSTENRKGAKQVRERARARLPCGFLSCLASAVSEDQENKKLPVKRGRGKLPQGEASGVGGLGTVQDEMPCWQ